MHTLHKNIFPHQCVYTYVLVSMIFVQRPQITQIKDFLSGSASLWLSKHDFYVKEYAHTREEYGKIMVSCQSVFTYASARLISVQWKDQTTQKKTAFFSLHVFTYASSKVISVPKKIHMCAQANYISLKRKCHSLHNNIVFLKVCLWIRCMCLYLMPQSFF